MKQLLTLILVFLGFASFGQNVKLRMTPAIDGTGSDSVVTKNINGAPLTKGDTIVIYAQVNGNGNSTTRQLYFDFEYQNTALTLLSINNTGVNGSGGALPVGASISQNSYQYPGYKFNQNSNNTTSNGNVNYQNANYAYSNGGNHTIIRYSLTWASTSGMPLSYYWGLVRLTFKLNTNFVGFGYDPVRMNFAASYNKDGSFGATTMEFPLTTKIYVSPTTEAYVNAKVDYNGNVDNFSLTRIAFTDSLNNAYLVDAASDGTINIDQTKLKPYTTYKVTTRFNADAVKDLMNAAVTVSDYTTAQSEFTGQNLDGTFTNSNIMTGAGYYAADVNNNQVFDGGDVTRIFAQTVALDSFYVLPTNYKPGTDVYLDVPTFTEAEFNSMTPANWKNMAVNHYVTFKTGKIGSNVPLNLRFLIPGDVNRSHSSQVYNSDGAIQTNAIVSLSSNSSIKGMSIGANSMLINTTKDISAINVTLNNATVTSNTIDVPVNINPNGNSVSALQFQFEYDTTKIKFEQLSPSLPSSWITFVNVKNGKVKFGAIDKGKNPITDAKVPFSIKFSTIGNGVDILTSVKVSPIMDASNSKGSQLGINLNTTTIKLTGYNNF